MIPMLALFMSLSLVSPAKALDPFTIVGAIASPIFCKLISCRSSETLVVYPNYPAKKQHLERLKQMRANFKWESFGDDCVSEEGVYGTKKCGQPVKE